MPEEQAKTMLTFRDDLPFLAGTSEQFIHQSKQVWRLSENLMRYVHLRFAKLTNQFH